MKNFQTYKTEIERLVIEHPFRYSRIIRDNHELYAWLSTTISYTNNIPEMVYAILHENDSAFCGSNNKRKFRNINIGWLNCDDKQCIYCKKRTLDKSKNTNLSRYGVENPMKVDSIKDKMVSRARENNSYEIAKEKRKQLYIMQYGVDHNWKTTEGQQKRVASLKEKYGVENPSNNPELCQKRKETNIKKYGVEHPSTLSTFKEKTKQSNLLKYGVDNVSKLPETRQQASTTMFDLYGVYHASQSPSFVEKAKKTCLERYGVENINQLVYYKDKIINTRKESFFNNIQERVQGKVIPLFEIDEYENVEKEYLWKCTTCHTEFTDNLDDGKIPKCTTCFPFIKSLGENELAEFILNLGFNDMIRNSRSIIAPLELDIFIPSKKMAIEYNGVYHHSEISGNKDKNYHLNKIEKCLEQVITLIQIYDTEWNNQKDLVKSRIRQKLGISSRIYARQCNIVELSNAESAGFVDANHIQRACNASIHYGLKYHDELIAVMTFGKSRYNKIAEYELLRYCTLPDISVVGGASKLLKHFEIDFNYPSLISYCDRRWNTGNVYKEIGFELHKISKPNYKYHKNSRVLESRIKYQAHKLSKLLSGYDQTKTEWENMQANGFDRIWDCGNLVYIKHKRSEI